MRTADFDFDLPGERIAEVPVEPRDAARLLVRRGGRSGPAVLEHRTVRDLPEVLEPGDLLVFNDTRVLPARVFARRRSGGRVELLFLEPVASAEAGTGSAESERDAPWRALVKPAKKLRAGEPLEVEGGCTATALVREGDSPIWHVALVGRSDESATSVLERVGAMPLPPYIERAASELDVERYQTVYAREPGAVAAPTAGLHFTEELLTALEARGVERAYVTLHVGAGTFLPVTADRVDDHVMHTERYTLSSAATEAVHACRARGGRVIPVGTTSARVLESAALADPAFERAIVQSSSGRTDIFLHPENRPRVADALFTNFHLPRSTLLMLVAAFIGREETLDLYRTAIREEYRFYSYGDATLLI